jgi:hypothetical protein
LQLSSLSSWPGSLSVIEQKRANAWPNGPDAASE